MLVPQFMQRATCLALLGIAACTTSPGPNGEAATRARMLRHFDVALELRDHAISGNLARFRSTARALAELEATGDLPPEILLQSGPLRYEAEVGSQARTVDAAARAAAEIARACGDCHTANGVSLAEEFPRPTPASSDPDTRVHMERLSRVTRQLWSGLVGPQEADWTSGVTGLIDAASLPSRMDDRVPPDELAFDSRRLLRLAEEARDAGTAGQRVRALGEIWGTCADCHARLDP